MEQIDIEILAVTAIPLAKPPSKPRTDKQKKHAAKRNDLKEIVYGPTGGKQHVPGTWTDKASMWMAEHPTEMRDFLVQRAAVGKALGSGRYLANPLEFICPIDGAVCQRADVGQKLGAPSSLTNICKHIKGAHRNHPLCKLILERLEKAEKKPSWKVEKLDTEVGALTLTNEFLASKIPADADAEAIDKVRDLDDAIRQNKSYFHAPFAFRTGDHHAWLDEWTSKAKEHSLMLEVVNTTVRSMLTDTDEIRFLDLIQKVKGVDPAHEAEYTELCMISLLKELEAGQTESFFAADDIDDPSVISKL